MRILVRTRYIAEVEPLAAAGADRVIAEELESVVQLFADVMRSYDIDGRRDRAPTRTTIRSGGYAALRIDGPPSEAGGGVHAGPGLSRSPHGARSATARRRSGRAWPS